MLHKKPKLVTTDLLFECGDRKICKYIMGQFSTLFHDFESFASHPTSYTHFVLFEGYAYVIINYCPCITVVSRSQ